jgi:hypothetical protein
MRRRPGAPGSVLDLEAECLGYEDDADPAGGFVVDDQRLCEQGSGTACTLHADVLSRQAVFAYAPKAFVEVADEFLVAHDEDDVAAGVRVGAELAAGARADDDLAPVFKYVGG